MLQKLLQSADLRQLTSFVSPAFFDVMPAGQIWSRGRSLITSRGRPVYQDAVKQRAQELTRVPLAVRLQGEVAAPLPDPLGGGVEGNATRLVTLYFHQIFSDTPTLLDLRRSSFKIEGMTLGWDPAPWVCSWDKAFLSSLRMLYRGFYAHDDQLFRRALTDLHIDLAEDLFRKHFGSEQSGQSFKMRDFVDTFHQVFVRCRDAKVRLHSDFLPLGVYLATLYDHLDGLEVKVDVAACFERVQPDASARSNGSLQAGGPHG
ncbi:MAG: hypothetical protein JWN48_3801 [Myxococcaceae bacterium]|nr:hypothetical protein [Myxococcaceae bacterium]